MPRSQDLIGRYLTGKSAKILIDEVYNESPPIDHIKRSIAQELPKDVKVDTVGESALHIRCTDRHKVSNTVALFEQIYPDVDFVVDSQGNKCGD